MGRIAAPAPRSRGWDETGAAKLAKPEAAEPLESGIRPRFIVLAASLPEQSKCMVEHDPEPVVCTEEGIESLRRAAARARRQLAVHVFSRKRIEGFDRVRAMGSARQPGRDRLDSGDIVQRHHPLQEAADDGQLVVGHQAGLYLWSSS